jgi:hypothetical protein
MLSIFRAVVERIKALFATAAAQELEAEFLARHAERQAGLLRLADRYDAEGLHGVAADLRRQAAEVSLDRPLAGVLPALSHLDCETHPPLLPDQAADAHSRPTSEHAIAGHVGPGRLPNRRGGSKSAR